MSIFHNVSNPNILVVDSVIVGLSLLNHIDIKFVLRDSNKPLASPRL